MLASYITPAHATRNLTEACLTSLETRLTQVGMPELTVAEHSFSPGLVHYVLGAMTGMDHYVPPSRAALDPNRILNKSYT